MEQVVSILASSSAFANASDLCKQDEIKTFFTQVAKSYATPSFIASDPIWVPHQFDRSEDKEISAFLTALIAWGRRAVITKFAWQWMKLMDFAPYDFLLHAQEKDLRVMRSFYYRTLSGEDVFQLIFRLWLLYQGGETLRSFAQKAVQKQGILGFWIEVRKWFGVTPVLQQLISQPERGAGKRIHLFLRWMVRKDAVDFGLWNAFLKPKELFIPLDTHVHRLSLRFQLIQRRTSDWKAVCELTRVLRTWNPEDPIFYDFAFIGLGTEERISKSSIFE